MVKRSACSFAKILPMTKCSRLLLGIFLAGLVPVQAQARKKDPPLKPKSFMLEVSSMVHLGAEYWTAPVEEPEESAEEEVLPEADAGESAQEESKPLETRKPGLLLLHQAGSSKWEWRFLITDLVNRGFNVLAVDLPGHGETLPKIRRNRAFYKRLFTDPEYAPPAVRAALSWLKSQEDIAGDRLGILGGSVGGNLAVASLALGEVKAAVCMSGHYKNAQRLAGRPEEFAPKGLFVLAADGDRGRVEHATKLLELSQNPKRMKILKGSNAHGVSILKESSGLRTAVLDWLEKNL